jgi:hypothetical protein
MTFVAVSNLVLIALCVIVIVQSLRMAKGIREFRTSSLNESASQIDAATARAQAVLNELKTVLATSAAAQNRALVSGEEMREELSVVIGIGNAVAERIIEAASLQNGTAQPEAPAVAEEVKAEEPAEKAATGAKRSGQRKPRSRSDSRRRKTTPQAAVLPPSVAEAPVVGHA